MVVSKGVEELRPYIHYFACCDCVQAGIVCSVKVLRSPLDEGAPAVKSQNEWLRHQLPALRRHGYLFVGSRKAADDAVLEAIHRYRAEAHDAPDEPRLHRILHECIEAREGPDPDVDPALVDQVLFKLTRHQRKMLLLVSLDQMHVDDAAAILGIGVTDAACALAEARRLFGAYSCPLVSSP